MIKIIKLDFTTNNEYTLQSNVEVLGVVNATTDYAILMVRVNEETKGEENVGNE